MNKKHEQLIAAYLAGEDVAEALLQSEAPTDLGKVVDAAAANLRKQRAG